LVEHFFKQQSRVIMSIVLKSKAGGFLRLGEVIGT